MKDSLKKTFYFIVIFAIFFGAYFFFSNIDVYRMNIYLNSEPSDTGKQEIKKCYSLHSDFNCAYNYPISGAYIKAITYEKNVKVSDSGWQLVQ